MELRFNPMKRNRGGEQDLDHIIAAAMRGMDRAVLEYPIKPGLILCLDRAFPYQLNEIIAAAMSGMDRAVLEYPIKPGLILCLDRAFPYQLNEIIAEKAISGRDRGIVGIDIAGPESSGFQAKEYRRLFQRVRRHHLGIT